MEKGKGKVKRKARVWGIKKGKGRRRRKETGKWKGRKWKGQGRKRIINYGNQSKHQKSINW